MMSVEEKREAKRVYSQSYHVKHREALNRKAAKYRDDNVEKLRIKRADCRAGKKEKTRLSDTEWDDKVKERQRAYDLRRLYGLTLQAYDSMFDAQEGLCAICSKQMAPAGVAGDSACVDHCHETGAVRALLCRKCNTSLGGFNDNPTTLRRAADYLDAHNGD